MKQVIDLNSDMGEGFGPWKIGNDVDTQIMPLISSANIATGFHAGDPNIMHKTVAMAVEHNVAIGAHPGFRDLVGFGRRNIKAPAFELVNDMLYQLGALREFVALYKVKLQHIKPHGALYMHLASDEACAELFIKTLQKLEPELMVYCMPNSVVYEAARSYGQPVIREFYGDRDYDLSGSIVFTRQTQKLDDECVAKKVLKACQEGKVTTVEGEELSIEFDSICIHSDTPNALKLVETTRSNLEKVDISIKSPS